MASPGELSGGEQRSPYAAEVERRNAFVQEFYASEKHAEVARHLKGLAYQYKDLGLINEASIAAVADREANLAGEEAAAKRQAGLLNDLKSKAPGIFITGILEADAFGAVEEELRMYNVDFNLEVERTGQTDWHYRLHVPEGVFYYGDQSDLVDVDYETVQDQEHLRIVGMAEFEERSRTFRPTGASLHLLTSGYIGHQLVHGGVGRIEGAAGEMWQNPTRMPDGSPRTQIEEANAA